MAPELCYEVEVRGVRVRCGTMEALLQLIEQANELPRPALVVPNRRVERRAKPRRATGYVVVPREGRATPNPAQLTADCVELRTVLGKAPHGLGLAELRQRLPKMERMRRRSALQSMQRAGEIRRAGNSWVLVAQDPGLAPDA